MSFSVGIVGLPNTGKSTLFKALTKKKVDIASYPFTTINPNVGVVEVPDKKLEKIASIVRPQKITNTVIEFVDIAGLIEGAHKGEGLGNQFLSRIKECDAIIEVIGAFKEKSDPKKNIQIIKNELLLKDIEIIEGIIEKLEKKAKEDKENIKEIELLKRIKESTNQGKPISELNLPPEEKEAIKKYQFLTEKPIVYLFNTRGEIINPDYLNIDLKIEEEASDLSPSEILELGLQSQLDQIILSCYNILDLITFYTITGGKEARARILKRGSNTLLAAEKVHSDFRERFIKAEVISWQKLVGAASWSKARELGLIKTVGKEYIVQNGDIIEFKI